MDNKNEFDKEFKNMTQNETLDIFSIEDLMIKSIDNYKEELLRHTEELLSKYIDEGKLITKKNKSGIMKELKSKILGNEN